MKLFTVTERVKVGIEVRGSEACGLPLSKELQERMCQDIEGMRIPQVFLVAADLEGTPGEGEQWIQERNERDKRALVCLHVSVKHTLFACTKQEELKGKERVARRFRPFEEAVGCRLLRTFELIGGEGQVVATEYLIEMLPGSSFLIHREGDLEGAPTLLTLKWEGRWDMSGICQGKDILDPKRYRFFVIGDRKQRKRHAAESPSFQAR